MKKIHNSKKIQFILKKNRIYNLLNINQLARDVIIYE
jgi:hypothetical protein